ncbi:MAG: DUF58 domain-containing protein [Methylocella sp.]
MNSGKHIAMTGADFFKEITYHIRWSPSQHTYGTHRARQYGTDGNFRDYVPFWQQPDARRIDLRQSLRNPFGEIYVRQSEQQSRIAAYIIADLSASMRFGEGFPKMRILRSLTLGLASSAHRSGDAFGFIGCDEDVRPDFFLPASVKRGSEVTIAERLRHFVPQGLNAHGFRWDDAKSCKRTPTRRYVFSEDDTISQTRMRSIASSPMAAPSSRSQVTSNAPCIRSWTSRLFRISFSLPA